MATLVAAFCLAACAACTDKGDGYDASGVFEATEVLVSAKGNGEILYFDVSEGQTVSPGTTLGLIDTTQLHLEKVQLQANIRALESRRVDIPRQLAALQEQIATQQRERQRFETLVSQNAATQKQLDDITAFLAQLEKQLAAQAETLQNGNNALTEERNALVAQVARLEDHINNALIQSPLAGTILAKYAEAGELTQADRALFKVADMNRLFLRAYVTADQLSAIRTGQAVTVYADAGQSERKEYRGTVTWISDRAEFTPKTIQTRNERANLVYAIKIAVENDGGIKRGMYGEVAF
jgi:HlyD family secretion protein